MTKVAGESRWVSLTGVSPWEPTSVDVPRRLARSLDVEGAAPAVLFVDQEPFFANVVGAAAQLREVLATFGATESVVYSRLLYRPVFTGAQAQQWLDESVGPHEWWPQDVSWCSPDGLRVLAFPSGNYEEITLMAWGAAARAFVDAVASGWDDLPKQH